MVEERNMGATGSGGNSSRSLYDGGRFEVLDKPGPTPAEGVGEEEVPYGDAAMGENSPDEGHMETSPANETEREGEVTRGMSEPGDRTESDVQDEARGIGRALETSSRHDVGKNAREGRCFKDTGFLEKGNEGGWRRGGGGGGGGGAEAISIVAHRGEGECIEKVSLTETSPGGEERGECGGGGEGRRGEIAVESSRHRRATAEDDDELHGRRTRSHPDLEKESEVEASSRSLEGFSHEDLPFSDSLAEKAYNGDGDRGRDVRVFDGEFDGGEERNPSDFECFHSDFPFCGCVSHQSAIYEEPKKPSGGSYAPASGTESSLLTDFGGEPQGDWPEEEPLMTFRDAPDTQPRRKLGCDMSSTLCAFQEPWMDVSDETEELDNIESSPTRMTEGEPEGYGDPEERRKTSCTIRISGAFEDEEGRGVRGGGGGTLGSLPPDGAVAELDSAEGAMGYSVPDTPHPGADMFPNTPSASSLLPVPPAAGQGGAGTAPSSRRASIITCDSRRTSVIVEPEPIRIAVFGKDGVGKSALIVRLLTKRFIGEYDPTMEAVYSYHLPPEAHHQPTTLDHPQTSHEPSQLPMQIMDTAGTMDVAEDGRESQVSWGEGFMLVFSLTSKATLHDLHHIRRVILELTPGAPRPMVLVGNKADLSHQREIQDEEIRELASCWGCDYFEVAASEPWEVVVRPFTAIYQAVLDARAAP
ncbi:uncharacterized protein LOC143017853 [Oratosquilla oratoria]|uniref:uncharacterized protein LOC143017853 n=1 Tax=Oratosquilla oratoria TaxID=337810 RepID=UPI003F761EFE